MRLVFALVLGMALLPVPSLAHEGHGDEEPEPVEVKNVSPRAEASSDLFEMLAVANGEQLIIYLDRFAGNEPVSGAEIEILADEEFEPVAARSPGVYAVPWHPEPGSYELTIAVLAGELDDLLILTIVIPEGAAAVESGGGLLGMGWFSTVVIVLLVAFAIFVLVSPARRRMAATAGKAIPTIVGARLGEARGRRRPGQDAGASPPAGATSAE